MFPSVFLLATHRAMASSRLSRLLSDSSVEANNCSDKETKHCLQQDFTTHAGVFRAFSHRRVICASGFATLTLLGIYQLSTDVCVIESSVEFVPAGQLRCFAPKSHRNVRLDDRFYVLRQSCSPATGGRSNLVPPRCKCVGVVVEK